MFLPKKTRTYTGRNRFVAATFFFASILNESILSKEKKKNGMRKFLHAILSTESERE